MSKYFKSTIDKNLCLAFICFGVLILYFSVQRFYIDCSNIGNIDTFSNLIMDIPTILLGIALLIISFDFYHPHVRFVFNLLLICEIVLFLLVKEMQIFIGSLISLLIIMIVIDYFLNLIIPLLTYFICMPFLFVIMINVLANFISFNSIAPIFILIILCNISYRIFAPSLNKVIKKFIAGIDESYNKESIVQFLDFINILVMGLLYIGRLTNTINEEISDLITISFAISIGLNHIDWKVLLNNN